MRVCVCGSAGILLMTRLDKSPQTIMALQFAFVLSSLYSPASQPPTCLGICRRRERPLDPCCALAAADCSPRNLHHHHIRVVLAFHTIMSSLLGRHGEEILECRTVLHSAFHAGAVVCSPGEPEVLLLIHGAWYA